MVTGLLTEGVTGDSIVCCQHFFSGFFQKAAASILLLTGAFQPLPTGCKVSIQFCLPLGCQFGAFGNGTQICFSGRQVTGVLDFCASQLHKLPGHTLGIGGHGCQFLLICIQNYLLFFQGQGNFFHTTGILLQLGGNIAAAVFLTV